jgi:hypothetical protein
LTGFWDQKKRFFTFGAPPYIQRLGGVMLLTLRVEPFGFRRITASVFAFITRVTVYCITCVRSYLCFLFLCIAYTVTS